MKDTNKKTFEKKEQLLKSAINEFGIKSYKNASLNKILSEANVSKGVFYHHYKNKEDLYIDIIKILFNSKKEFIVSSMTKDDDKTDFFKTIRKNIMSGLEFAKQSPEISKVSEMFMKERGNEIYDKVMTMFNAKDDVYINLLIERGIDNGDLRNDLSEDFLRKIINHMLSNVYEILDTKNINDYTNQIDEYLAFFESGLRMKNN